jgi:hypothetical protein
MERVVRLGACLFAHRRGAEQGATRNDQTGQASTRGWVGDRRGGRAKGRSETVPSFAWQINLKLWMGLGPSASF